MAQEKVLAEPTKHVPGIPTSLVLDPPHGWNAAYEKMLQGGSEFKS